MLQTGQVIAGRYRIGERIGAGGMAEVYEARHLITEHAVAIKVLRPSADGSRWDGAPHIELEAKIDARVGSPHIVRVQDAGIDEATGAPFLVMELLRGRALDRMIKEHPERRLPVAEALDIARQVALGLDAAHALSVIHRDLKPENVFVTLSSGVKILDFGIAKILDASGHVTRELRGTPYYMAPEQAKGEPVSPATDIWAFGLTVYRALTGRVYWRVANAPRDVTPLLAEIVYEITVVPPAPPSARLAEQGARIHLPAGFDAWFLRCIERDPRARFESASSAVRALEDVFAAGPEGVLPLSAAPAPELVASTQPTRTYRNASTPGSVSVVAFERPSHGRLFRLAQLAVPLAALVVLAALLRPRVGDPPNAAASASPAPAAAGPLPATDVGSAADIVRTIVALPDVPPAHAALPAPLGERAASPARSDGTPPATPAATEKRPAARRVQRAAPLRPPASTREQARVAEAPAAERPPIGWAPVAAPENAMDWVYGVTPSQVSQRRPSVMQGPASPPGILGERREGTTAPSGSAPSPAEGATPRAR